MVREYNLEGVTEETGYKIGSEKTEMRKGTDE